MCGHAYILHLCVCVSIYVYVRISAWWRVSSPPTLCVRLWAGHSGESATQLLWANYNFCIPQSKTALITQRSCPNWGYFKTFNFTFIINETDLDVTEICTSLYRSFAWLTQHDTCTNTFAWQSSLLWVVLICKCGWWRHLPHRCYVGNPPESSTLVLVHSLFFELCLNTTL